MELFEPTRLRSLLADEGGLRLSCFMPCRGAGVEADDTARCFDRLMYEAELALRARGLGPREATRLIAPIVAETETTRFWDRRRQGIAAFSSCDGHAVLACDQRFRPRVAVGRRYSIVPLLPLLNRDPHGYVLALGRRRVRLIELSRERAADDRYSDAVPLLGGRAADREIDEAAGWGGEAAGPLGDAAADAAAHALARGADELFAPFCRRIDAALANEIEHADSPVVAAGEPAVTSTFRRVAKHLAVLGTIEGEPDGRTPDELGGMAWPMMAERVSEHDEALVELFHERRAEQQASDSLAEIFAAAREGRVDMLLLSREAARTSVLDGPRAVTPGEAGEVADESFFNVSAVSTLRAGGATRLLDASQMPTRGSIAAIFRY